jgi:hypothetical protein
MLNVLGMGSTRIGETIVGFGFQVDLGENRAQQLLAFHNSWFDNGWNGNFPVPLSPT